MECIVLGKTRYITVDGGWQEIDSDYHIETPHVWDTREVSHVSEASGLLEFDKEFEKVFGKEKSSSVYIIRHDKLIKAYLGGVQQEYKTAYLDALSLEHGYVCAERILDDEGQLVGALIFTIGRYGAKVKRILESEHPTWKRELITARKEGVTKYYLPKWLHEQLGEIEAIANTPIEVVYEPVILPLLEKSASKCIGISYSEWKKREATKTKAKSFLNYALIGFGIACYGAVGYMNMDARAMKETRIRLDNEVTQLVSKREQVEKNRFFVDWILTPSIVDLLRTVTTSLGSVQITEMVGDVELGKSARIEGTALALDGKLRPKKVKGMRVDAVMTKGKVGLHFILEKKVNQ